MSKKSQQKLWEGEWWEEHWQDMPEFCQEDLMPFKSITVHFESRQDMEAFAKLVGQRVTKLTKSIWYPEPSLEDIRNKRYVSET